MRNLHDLFSFILISSVAIVGAQEPLRKAALDQGQFPFERAPLRVADFGAVGDGAHGDGQLSGVQQLHYATPRAPEELCDLGADPWAVRNLTGNIALVKQWAKQGKRTHPIFP